MTDQELIAYLKARLALNKLFDFVKDAGQYDLAKRIDTLEFTLGEAIAREWRERWDLDERLPLEDT